MTQLIPVSAQALFRSFLLRQITPWQSVWCPPPVAEPDWQTLSATLYSTILEPMWWCCRGPKPVTFLQKDSLFWLVKLTQDPTPTAGRLWVASVKLRYQLLTGEPLLADIDTFLLRCFLDFSVIEAFYKTGGCVNEQY